jgi:hypothetical protein
MKKVLIILGSITLLIFLYTQVILSIYVHLQSKSICNWLNDKEENKPAVGPQGYEHLKWIKEKSSAECQCKVVEPNRDFYESDVKTILITENGIEKIRLNYTLSYGGRSFMQPKYFHHQTDIPHEHSEYRFNYKD